MANFLSKAEKFGGKTLRYLLKTLIALAYAEGELLATLVIAVKTEGLTGDEARKEVQRRFRAQWKQPISDSFLNLLIEATVALNT